MRAVDAQPVCWQFGKVGAGFAGLGDNQRRGAIPVQHCIQASRSGPFGAVERKAVVGQPVEPHTVAEEPFEAAKVIGRQMFGRIGRAQCVDVLRRFGLGRARGHCALERHRVDTVCHDQARDQVWPGHGQPIGNRCAPVVAQNPCARPVCLDQGGHVGDQAGERVMRGAPGSPALAISALIRGNAMKCVLQMRCQIAPASAVFGETVQHQQQGFVGGAPALQEEAVAVQGCELRVHVRPFAAAGQSRPCGRDWPVFLMRIKAENACLR